MNKEQDIINHLIKLLEEQVRQKKAVEQQERKAKGLYFLVD
jgi:hypothetical protein